MSDPAQEFFRYAREETHGGRANGWELVKEATVAFAGSGGPHVTAETITQLAVYLATLVETGENPLRSKK